MTTDNVLVFPDSAQTEEQAAEWVVRLADGMLPDEEQAAFDAWHAANYRHREAFARLSHLWRHCDALSELNDHAVADITRASLAARGRFVNRFLVDRRASIAAAAAAVALLAWGMVSVRTTAVPSTAVEDTYQTVSKTLIGERRTLALPDGSSVQLNTASQATVRFETEARHVWLTQGEAHFSVASDPKRPFSVHASGRVITAVGTAFTVKLRRDAVEVMVAEGRVTLRERDGAGGGPRTAAPDSPASLVAGQRAIWAEGQRQVATLTPAELERKLAWRQGTLAFAGEPLMQVLGEIGRYTDVVFEVRDPDLRDLPVAGQLRIDDVENMLQALQLMADVRVERVSERHVRLWPRRRN